LRVAGLLASVPGFCMWLARTQAGWHGAHYPQVRPQVLLATLAHGQVSTNDFPRTYHVVLCLRFSCASKGFHVGFLSTTKTPERGFVSIGYFLP